MKNKKFRSLWAETRKKCCLKKFLELDFWAKYGSLSVILVSTLAQSYNVVIGKDFELSFISILFNLFFLLVILLKLNIIKMDVLNPYINSVLKFLIFLFLLNFLMYIFVDDILYNYFYAPMSFLGAYFIFLLLKRDSFI